SRLSSHLAPRAQRPAQARAAFRQSPAPPQAHIPHALRDRPAKPPDVPPRPAAAHATPLHYVGEGNASAIPVSDLVPGSPRTAARQVDAGTGALVATTDGERFSSDAAPSVLHLQVHDLRAWTHVR